MDAWIQLMRWSRMTRAPLTESLRPSVRRALALERLRILLDLLEGMPEVREQFGQSVTAILARTDATNLFGQAGLPSHRGLLGAFGERLIQQLLPRPRDSHDLAMLVRHLYSRRSEVERFTHLLPEVFLRIVGVMVPPNQPEMWKPLWVSFADGFRLLAARVQAQGLVDELRSRSSPLPVSESPFYRLLQASDVLVQVWNAGGDVAPAAAAWRWESQGCWAELPKIRERLETDGVSVDIEYGLEVIERCLERMENMVQIMETPPGTKQTELVHGFFAQLITASSQDRSLVHLVRSSTNLLHRKIVDRSGQAGEHYIAYNRKEYWHIWLAAAGGGLLTTITAAIKTVILQMKFAPFFEGLAYGLNYAVSFVLMQTYGLILATKQPAMTAATLASIMRGHKKGTERLDELVDFTTRIVHSQVAAAASNVVVVAAGAYAFDGLWRLSTGHPFLDLETARHVYDTLRPLHGGTVIFAALTGVILWLSSLVGGWIDNWAVYHRVPQGIADSLLAERVGRRRLQRIADYVARNIGGWGTNVSLGFMLGVTPALGHIFGIPLDVRHVTLSTGTLALSTAALGYDWFGEGMFLRALAGVGTMFVLNLGVSFFLSLFTAVRAYNLPWFEITELLRRLLRRFFRHPGDFILPPRTAAEFTGHAHG